MLKIHPSSKPLVLCRILEPDYWVKENSKNSASQNTLSSPWVYSQHIPLCYMRRSKEPVFQVSPSFCPNTPPAGTFTAYTYDIAQLPILTTKRVPHATQFFKLYSFHFSFCSSLHLTLSLSYWLKPYHVDPAAVWKCLRKPKSGSISLLWDSGECHWCYFEVAL